MVALGGGGGVWLGFEQLSSTTKFTTILLGGGSRGGERVLVVVVVVVAKVVIGYTIIEFFNSFLIRFFYEKILNKSLKFEF